MKSEHLEKLIILLASRKKLTLKVISDSMTPLINVGCKVEVIPHNLDTLKRWDIIVFNLNNMMTVHIFWGESLLDKNAILTRSIKEFHQTDQITPKKNILGIVKNYKISTPIKILLFFRILFNR